MTSKEPQTPDIYFFLGIALSGVGVALISITPYFLVMTGLGVVLIVIGMMRSSGAFSRDKH